jgi:primosomal protein N' (replication factor Y)
MSQNFYEVLLPLALDQAFTYASENILEAGSVVRVQFGKKEIWGVVLRDSVKIAEEKTYKIKEIIESHSLIKLSKNHLAFIEDIAAYNLGSRGLVLRAFIGILNSDKVKKLPKPLEQKIEPESFSLKTLSEKQQEVADEINLETSEIALLDGVTGCGKTEIYFAKVAEILRQKNNSQVLILIPEIALTSQLLLRFEEQFKFQAALWHSKISKKQKREIFYGICDGSIRLIIGARSALLLPFKNLKLVVIDEEHDSSFKQEDVFNFHARDMAILKAKKEIFPVILASATPVLETYNNAVSGKFKHFKLEQRFGAKNEINLIDLRQHKLEKGTTLSPILRSEIAKNLAEKKQVMLFLNRRGYAPTVLCKSCGGKSECENCDFNLVLHRSKKILTCHHCGHSERPSNSCKSCGEPDSLVSLGFGVERLEEEVREVFPDARIALVTSDNVSSFAEAQKVVKEIIDGEIDIIIGTQMISKGYDFANLHLVGIVNADDMLYSSDLRALERAYQMLTQVIGRAGRRVAGKVLIQTYNPENLIFEKISKDSKKDFYDFELENRKILEYPPFSRFVKFEVSSFSEGEAKNFAKYLIRHFPVNDKIELFGPAPAPLQRLKNRHHFLVHLKVQKSVNLQKLISDVMATLEIKNSVRVRIDIDPT